MSAIVVHIHFSRLVVIQLLPDVCFVLQQQVIMLPSIGSKALWMSISSINPSINQSINQSVKQSINQPVNQTTFTFGVSRVQSLSIKQSDEPINQSTINQPIKRTNQSISKNFHLWCEPGPRLVRPSVVFVARRHFDIVVELDYLKQIWWSLWT